MGVADDNCCTFLGRNFLITINLLSAVLGLLLCAGGAYLYVEYENQFDALLSPTPIVGIMAAGFVLFLVTIMGVYGAITGKRWILMLYLAVVVVLLALEIGATVIFLDYFDFIEASASSESSTLSDSTEIAINNFMLRSYGTCCVDTDNCVVNFANVCTDVELCASGNATDGCIVDDEIVPVDISVCTAFSEFKWQEERLVGPVEPGNDITCGGGDPVAFQAALVAWLESNIVFFGYGAIAVGTLQILIVLSGFALVLMRPSLIPKAAVLDDDDESPAPFAQPMRVDSSRLSVDRYSVASSVASGNAQRYSTQRYSAQRGMRPVSMASSARS